jgi:ATP-dependent RNA helicase MSS116
MRVAAAMTHPERQTLLFTATASNGVRELSRSLLKGDDTFMDAGSGGDGGGSAGAAHNANVAQEAVLVRAELMVPVVRDEFRRETGGLTVIFVPTAAMASTLASVLRAYKDAGTSVFEIHSRLSQAQRSRAVADFKRAAPPAAIVATDVFARGLDVSGVTLVLQFGIAPDNAQVAHRVGRTGRGGARGRSLMVLSVSEERVLRDLIDREKMPIVLRPPPPTTMTTKDMPVVASSPAPCKAFIASIGFYKAQMKRLGWKSGELVPFVHAMFAPLGVKTIGACPVNAKLVKKMGLPADHGLSLK